MDLQSIRTAIQQSRLTNQTTSITNSLDLAHEILVESKNRNREIYLITDLAGWDGYVVFRGSVFSRSNVLKYQHFGFRVFGLNYLQLAWAC